MIVWVLNIDNMGGGGRHHTAFTDKRTAELKAAKLGGEWERYVPEDYEAEEIPGGRCIVESQVLYLDRTPSEDVLRQQALSKLTPEEATALLNSPVVKEDRK